MSRVGWLKSSTASSRASSPAASTSGGGGGGRRSTSVAPSAGSAPTSAGGPSSSSSLLSSKAAAVVNLYPQMTRPDTSRFEDEKKRISEFKTADDQCPICRSDRYLNPKLRLLVSTVCYHKMCESCIERIFNLGPAPCPTCGVLNRKSGFGGQTFEDLKVEEEVDIRRRVARDFNKRRDDFVDSKGYNDYLEEVEDITFNLLNGIDLPATHARIAAYRAANSQSIAEHSQRDEEDARDAREREREEREEREWRRDKKRKEEVEREDEDRKWRGKVLRDLEFSSADASSIMSATARPVDRAPSPPPLPASLHSSRLRRTKQAAKTNEPPPPYVDPYDDYSGKITLLHKYFDPVMAPFLDPSKNVAWLAGGFKVAEVWERSLRFAVGGLDVDVLRDEEGEGGAEGMVVD